MAEETEVNELDSLTNSQAEHAALLHEDELATAEVLHGGAGNIILLEENTHDPTQEVYDVYELMGDVWEEFDQLRYLETVDYLPDAAERTREHEPVNPDYRASYWLAREDYETWRRQK